MIQIKDYIDAGFSGIWLRTCEPDEAELEIRKQGVESNWAVHAWDLARGYSDGAAIGDPIGAVSKIASLSHRPIDEGGSEGHVIVLLHNFHNFMTNPMTVQTLFNHTVEGKKANKHFVILSPIINLPPELEKVFLVLEHSLPDREQLLDIAINTDPDSVINDDILDAASGLTRAEAEGAFALSAVRHGSIGCEEVWKLKASTLKKANLLQLSEDTATFADLGGLDALKTFCQRALSSKSEAKARGVLLLGLPGCLHADTPIHDPVDGSTISVKNRSLAGHRFHVWSMDRFGRAVIAEAEPPRRYPIAKMVRIATPAGSVVVTHGHRLLSCNSQWVSASDVLRQHGFGEVRLASTSGTCLEARRRDGLRCLQTQVSSPGGCLRGCSSGDAQPLSDRGIFQVSPPSQGGALGRTSTAFRNRDATGRTQARIRSCLYGDRRATLGLPRLPGIETVDGPRCRTFSATSTLSAVSSRAIRRLRSDAVQSRTNERTLRDDQWSTSGVASCLVSQCANASSDRYTVVSKIEDAGQDHYYDFHVPVHENYWACGMWHHNTGKTAFAKALGNEMKRPTLILDLGRLKGGIVGQSEGQIRQALKIADAMAPCILFVDEIEKALAGATGYSGDSGVSQDQFGCLLQWMNDKTSDVFLIGTANDVKKMQEASAGAFVRAERWDGIFFFDMPTAAERNAIWDMYRAKYDIGEDFTASDVDDEDFTGAEIKACCRLASLLGITIEEAAKNVIPVVTTGSDQINSLREWASQKCLSASVPGRYSNRPAKVEASRGRKITKAGAV